MDKKCEKCGFENTSLRPTFFKDKLIHIECLKYTCRNCGYTWEMPCLDKEVKHGQ